MTKATKEENEIIRGLVIRMHNERCNCKLTAEEQAVFNKYNLIRNGEYIRVCQGWASLDTKSLPRNFVKGFWDRGVYHSSFSPFRALDYILKHAEKPTNSLWDAYRGHTQRFCELKDALDTKRWAEESLEDAKKAMDSAIKKATEQYLRDTAWYTNRLTVVKAQIKELTTF